MTPEQKHEWETYISVFIKNYDDSLKEQVKTTAFKILGAQINPKDDWSQGFNTGLEWAVRILMKDKSAY